LREVKKTQEGLREGAFRITGLSKSRFMAGMQCHKRLYVETFRPEVAGSADESGEATFDVGHPDHEDACEERGRGSIE
jgi:hypothetical protein